MKRNRVFRLLASLTVVVLCMTAFSVTAFAGGGDGDYYTGEPAETTPEPTEEPATGGMEPEGQPLTPEGNATLVDDYYGDKQLITVTTKAGNYFYILIDRANEDKETAVHFLNQVDEADLMALLEDGQTEETPAACTCAEKCQAGAVNTACPVCSVNMSECAGKAPEVEPEPEPEPEKESGSSGALVLISCWQLWAAAEPSPTSSSSSQNRAQRSAPTRTTMSSRTRNTKTRMFLNRENRRTRIEQIGDL